jgi:hypothetical protein
LNSISNIFKVILGVILLIIGLIGGLIPVFQGWVFGLPGLMLLGSVFPSVKKITQKLIKKIKKPLKK